MGRMREPSAMYCIGIAIVVAHTFAVPSPPRRGMHVAKNSSNVTDLHRKYDTDQDGHFHHEEFHVALEGHGVDITPGEAKKVFGKHDHDLDGKITVDQLQRAVKVEHENTLQRRVERYLWPIGMLSCPLLWVFTFYSGAKIVIFDDLSD